MKLLQCISKRRHASEKPKGVIASADSLKYQAVVYVLWLFSSDSFEVLCLEKKLVNWYT